MVQIHLMIKMETWKDQMHRETKKNHCNRTQAIWHAMMQLFTIQGKMAIQVTIKISKISNWLKTDIAISWIIILMKTMIKLIKRSWKNKLYKNKSYQIHSLQEFLRMERISTRWMKLVLIQKEFSNCKTVSISNFI